MWPGVVLSMAGLAAYLISSYLKLGKASMILSMIVVLSGLALAWSPLLYGPLLQMIR